MEKDIIDKISENQKAYINFLVDVNNDRKKDSRFHKITILLLIVLLIISLAVIAYVSIYCQKKIAEQSESSERRMYEFLSEYDFTGTIDIDTGTITNSKDSGYVNFEAR